MRISPRIAVLSALAVVASMLAGVGVVSAQTGQTGGQCAGDSQFVFSGWGFGRRASGTIVSPGSRAALGLPSSRAIAVGVAAGTYDVSAAAYDGHEDRAEESPQAHEQFHLEFLDDSGQIIDETGSTADLADEVDEATWVGPVGRVVLDRSAVEVRAVHSFTGSGPGTAHSVMPTCVGLDLVATTTTTVVSGPETTLPPETTLAPTTTVAAPTTTVAAPTTTIVTEVLGIQESDPAEPIPATPNFTG
jgi:hypothetical protein